MTTIGSTTLRRATKADLAVGMVLSTPVGVGVVTAVDDVNVTLDFPKNCFKMQKPETHKIETLLWVDCRVVPPSEAMRVFLDDAENQRQFWESEVKRRLKEATDAIKQ